MNNTTHSTEKAHGRLADEAIMLCPYVDKQTQT